MLKTTVVVPFYNDTLCVNDRGLLEIQLNCCINIISK